MQDMSEASFHQAVDRVQDLIEHALDDGDLDLDMEHIDGSLVLILPEGQRLAIGRQPASRELWLATPERTLHFNFDAEQGWLHDSGEGTLGEVLAAVLEDISGEELELDIDADSL